MTQAPDLLRVVSVSGGKDSTATLLLALETCWLDDVRAVFADTGNEHETTYEYVEYISEYFERETGRRIETVRADFTKAMADKRDKLLKIAAGVPESEIYGKRKFVHSWTPAAASRAAELLYPTGNVFLDLCMLRGGFPSRLRAFCTEELKQLPIMMNEQKLLETHRVESWQGVRGGESERRAKLAPYEWGPLLSTRRPIFYWDVARVFEQHARHGIKPNQLYLEGAARVGCMPCINSGKSDLSLIASRFPEHIDKVREYERLVNMAARPCRTPYTFIHSSKAPGITGIDSAVQWAKTTHGGKQYDLLADAEDATQCSSEYGLCE